MKKQLLTLLILAIFLISPYAQTVDAVTRYTRITGDDPFYIITGEATNDSNTHFTHYRIELDPTTYNIINKTPFNKLAQTFQPSTPYYYSNKVLFSTGIYDINTLNEEPTSVADFTGTFDLDLTQGTFTGVNKKYATYYDPLKKYYYVNRLSQSGTFTSTTIINDKHFNNLLSITQSVSGIANRPHAFSNGGMIRRTSTTAGFLFYPNNDQVGVVPLLPAQQKPYSIELLPSGSQDATYFYTQTEAGSGIVQAVMNNVTTSVRTITPTLSAYPSHTPLSSRSNYLYIAGHSVITGNTTYNVAGLEVRDKSGNLVTGFNSATPDTKYTFITELETGDFAVIEHNTNTSSYRIIFYNPLTLTIINSINYDQKAVYTIASKLKNTKGIDPVQFNQMNSGVYSRETGGFDAVPKDAYRFMDTATEPASTTITNVDFTNREYSLEYTTTNDIDFYPLYFLVDDDEFKTTTNEKYGYFTLSEMAITNTIDTGVITASDTYTLTTALSNNRFYVADTNITLLNTSAVDYVTLGIELNGNYLFSLQNLIDEYVTLYYENIADLEFTTPHLMAYPSISGSALDYINLKLLLDKHNNRYAINKVVYFNDGTRYESGFITWTDIPVPSSESITNITFDLSGSTSADIDMTVYRQNDLPTMSARNPDSTYTNAKSLFIPILREGENKVYVLYSDTGTPQHANFYEWNINIDVIGGTILGIGPSGETTETTPELVPQGTLIFGGLLPDFMGTTQQSVMFYAFAITLLAMLIIFIMGAGAGYAPIGFIGALAFGIMLIIYFAIVGWLPAWIPVLGFVIAGLIGASMIRNAFVGGA